LTRGGKVLPLLTRPYQAACLKKLEKMGIQRQGLL
jgi:hypothetical protein